MKCKICGFSAYSLPAMSKHYRKKHPNKMKGGVGGARFTKKERRIIARLRAEGELPSQQRAAEEEFDPYAWHYCPQCGARHRKS